MLYIMGFDKDLWCGGTQFEIGKEYKREGELYSFCEDLTTAHARQLRANLSPIHAFCPCEKRKGDRFCYIECLSEVVREGGRFGGSHIRIVREIVGDELNLLFGLVNGNVGLFNTGNRNTGDHNTGDWNNGDHNTGDRNTGNGNTGKWNSGHMNTGDKNTGNTNKGHGNAGDWNSGNWNSGNGNNGDWNSGDWNVGDKNTGDRNSGEGNSGHMNTGDKNTGDKNSGEGNSGDWNAGDRNTGMLNSCNYSTGVFCEKSPTINIFDCDSGMTMEEFKASKFYNAIISAPFDLTKWDDGQNKTVTIDFKQACAAWWGEMAEENRKIIKEMPNFNAVIFERITGLKV